MASLCAGSGVGFGIPIVFGIAWSVAAMIEQLMWRWPKLRAAVDAAFLTLTVVSVALTFFFSGDYRYSAGDPGNDIDVTMVGWDMQIEVDRSGATVHDRVYGVPGYSQHRLPFWIPMILLPPTTLLLWRRRLSRWVGFRERRYRVGCCDACGYDLRGNVSGICPECGTPDN